MAAADVAAARYAAAYFDLASRDGDTAAWRSDLARAVEALGDPGSLAVLANPRVGGADRVGFALSLLDGARPQLRNLVRLLLERGRVRILPEVLRRYDQLVDRASGTVRAEVVAAVEVDARLERRIAAALQQSLGASVQTTVRQDPAILGGLVIRIGDRVIDGSVRTRLEQLRAALA